MKNLDEKSYIEEIEKVYINLKGCFSLLSPKEAQVIHNWYKNNVKLDYVTNVLKKEILKLPKKKRKKFSLIQLDKIIKEEISSKSNDKKLDLKEDPKVIRKKRILSKWKEISKKKNIPASLLQVPDDFNGDLNLYLEKKVIDYIWKNLPIKEKERLVNEALEILKGEKIPKTDKKHAVKAIIYDKIKKEIEGY